MPIYRKYYHTEALMQLAVEKEEGKINADGVLCTYTGKNTGRSPNAKKIVKIINLTINLIYRAILNSINKFPYI